MTWRWVLALSGASVALAAGGCKADEPLRAGSTPVAFTGPPQAGAGALAATDTTVARSQKPEGAAVVPPPGAIRQVAAVGTRAASVRATVNGEAILDEEVRATCYHALMLARSPQEQAKVFNEALEEIIKREVVLQEALGKLAKAPNGQGAKLVEKIKEDASEEFKKTWVTRMLKGNKLKNEEELRDFLRENGMNFQEIRRQWERQFMMMQYLHFRIGPYVARIGHAELVAYYDQRPEQFQVPESIEWQDLFIDAAEHGTRDQARAFADVLAGRIRQGEDFVALGRQYDRGESRLRNSKGTGSHRGEVRPVAAEPLLFAMNDGDVGVLETANGFHVIRLVHHEHAHRMPFDEKVQKEIKNKLREEVFTRESKRMVEDLRRKAVIEIYADTN